MIPIKDGEVCISGEMNIVSMSKEHTVWKDSQRNKNS